MSEQKKLGDALRQMADGFECGDPETADQLCVAADAADEMDNALKDDARKLIDLLRRVESLEKNVADHEQQIGTLECAYITPFGTVSVRSAPASGAQTEERCPKGHAYDSREHYDSCEAHAKDCEHVPPPAEYPPCIKGHPFVPSGDETVCECGTWQPPPPVEKCPKCGYYGKPCKCAWAVPPPAEKRERRTWHIVDPDTRGYGNPKPKRYITVVEQFDGQRLVPERTDGVRVDFHLHVESEERTSWYCSNLFCVPENAAGTKPIPGIVYPPAAAKEKP